MNINLIHSRDGIISAHHDSPIAVENTLPSGHYQKSRLAQQHCSDRLALLGDRKRDILKHAARECMARVWPGRAPPALKTSTQPTRPRRQTYMQPTPVSPSRVIYYCKHGQVKIARYSSVGYITLFWCFRGETRG